jgi:phage-related protein
MRQQYKAFQFDGQVFHENMDTGFKLINATLDNDFYMQCIRGPRIIIEDQIPGRDIPYFYEVDDTPLEFEVTFAFAEFMTKTQIKTIVRKLFSPITYKELTFGDYVSLTSTYTAKTPIYKVIFHGETDINYVQGANDKYIAYFTLTARADRPYGFNQIQAQINGSPTASQISITSTGDITFFPNMILTNPGTTNQPIRIFNETNGSSVTFTELYTGEIITINSKLKTISTNLTNPSLSIYQRWQRNDLFLSPGVNLIKFQTNTGTWIALTVAAFTLTGEAPVYVYDTN